MKRWLVVASLFGASCTQEGPKAGAPHEHLKAHAGTWESKSLLVMGDRKIEGGGVQTETLAGNGLWLVIDAKGKFGPGEFWGHGMTGYDGTRKKYVASWVDSTIDYVMSGEGECSADGTTLTMVYQVRDPADPSKIVPMKEVTRFTDQDNKTMTISCTDPAGQNVEFGTIILKRKK